MGLLAHLRWSAKPAAEPIAAPAFAELVVGDTLALGKQHPAFVADPYGVLRSALGRSKCDRQTRDEYERNLLPLIYGDFKPRFDEAFASFEQVAETLLAGAGK